MLSGGTQRPALPCYESEELKNIKYFTHLHVLHFYAYAS